MEMALWGVDEAGQALAGRLPKGKTFGSGRAFTPFVSGKLLADSKPWPARRCALGRRQASARLSARF